MSLAPTDLATLETAIHVAIRGITPTHTRAQALGWTPVPGDRPNPPGERTRAYRLSWEPGGFVEEGLYGQEASGGGVHEVESVLHVEVDYGGIPAESLADIVDDDLYDLAATLEDLAAPTTTGLTQIESEGRPQDIADENEGDQAQYDFSFLVRYMKARP